MLNRYQRDPDEFRRIVSIISAGMTWSETASFLGYKINYLAQALGLRPNVRRRITAHAVHRHIMREMPTEPYVDPADIPPVRVPPAPVAPPTPPAPPPPVEPETPATPEPEPDVEGDDDEGVEGQGEGDIECCAPVPGASLRWAKADRGEPVTYSVDRTDAPDFEGFSEKEIDWWFTTWSYVCGIVFDKLSEGKGDIHVQFKPIDGPGKTLGFAWQPSNNAEFMEQAGDLSGDITIDSSERDWQLWKTRTTGRHEVGHAIGADHSESFNDLMFGSVVFNRETGLSPRDIAKAVEKYPLRKSA